MRVSARLILAGCLLSSTATQAAVSVDPAAAAAASAKPAATAKPAAEASIAFANHGGIWNWQVEDRSTVLIQSQHRKWYRAKLMSPCFDLPFAETVGFETNADGSFDRFGSVNVRGQRCVLVSLVETAAPAKKVKNFKSTPKLAPAATTHSKEGDVPK